MVRCRLTRNLADHLGTEWYVGFDVDGARVHRAKTPEVGILARVDGLLEGGVAVCDDLEFGNDVS